MEMYAVFALRIRRLNRNIAKSFVMQMMPDALCIELHCVSVTLYTKLV